MMEQVAVLVHDVMTKMLPALEVDPAKLTGRQMCERIVESGILRRSDTGESPTALDVWNYSAQGELFMVFHWYVDACWVIFQRDWTQGKYLLEYKSAKLKCTWCCQADVSTLTGICAECFCKAFWGPLEEDNNDGTLSEPINF